MIVLDQGTPADHNESTTCAFTKVCNTDPRYKLCSVAIELSMRHHVCGPSTAKQWLTAADHTLKSAGSLEQRLMQWQSLPLQCFSLKPFLVIRPLAPFAKAL